MSPPTSFTPASHEHCFHFLPENHLFNISEVLKWKLSPCHPLPLSLGHHMNIVCTFCLRITCWTFLRVICWCTLGLSSPSDPWIPSSPTASRSLHNLLQEKEKLQETMNLHLGRALRMKGKPFRIHFLDNFCLFDYGYFHLKNALNFCCRKDNKIFASLWNRMLV